MAQFGSGSALLGGGVDALSQAMASRGVDTSALQQMSPSSSGGQPPIPVPVPTPSQSAPLSAPNVPSNNPSTVQGQSASGGEAELILKALSGRLSALSKMGIGSNQPQTSY